MRRIRCLSTVLLIASGCAREPPPATIAPPPFIPAPWPTQPPPQPPPPQASIAPPAVAAPEPSASLSPAPAAPIGGCAALDCASCASRPGCAWCAHPRGCLPASEQTSCPGNNYWITVPQWCGSVDRGANTASLTPVDAPRSGRLETMGPLQWRVRRGLCYELLVKLAPGAKIDRSVLYGRIRDPIQDMSAPVVVVFGDTPPVFGEPACPRGAGTFTLAVKDVYDNFVSPKRGSGAFEAQLFARPIAEATLTTREKVDDERFRKGMCKGCRQDYSACFYRGDTGCEAAFNECLRLNGLRPDQCQ